MGKAKISYFFCYFGGGGAPQFFSKLLYKHIVIFTYELYRFILDVYNDMHKISNNGVHVLQTNERGFPLIFTIEYKGNDMFHVINYSRHNSPL
jgi:hypothetical protein